MAGNYWKLFPLAGNYLLWQEIVSFGRKLFPLDLMGKFVFELILTTGKPHSQGGILTVILASRMIGNLQISGEIYGQNHASFMSRMGSGQNHV